MFCHEYPPDWTEADGSGHDPSPFDLHVRKVQEQRRLQQQIQKFGDETMRTVSKAPLGSVPVEKFERSYHLKMPGATAKKIEKPDPCKRLLKAMNIRVSDQTTKRRVAY
eukprot:SAG11_NODE_6269_length_1346_cov_2.362470_2_plen_109_part_00